jgi:hypothetical protein
VRRRVVRAALTIDDLDRLVETCDAAFDLAGD